MTRYKFSGKLKELICRAEIGNPSDVDYIMSHLSEESSFEITRYVDYSMGIVNNPEGFERIKYYLFKGTLIQRNYACLYFNRRYEWQIVREAWKKGLVDETQAFAR